MRIDEITTERLTEISDQRGVAYYVARNRLAVEALKQQWLEAQAAAANWETQCQVRALKMRGQGMPIVVVAEWFDVPVYTVKRWYRNPLRVMVTNR
jgi:hypothetical protein